MNKYARLCIELDTAGDKHLDNVKRGANVFLIHWAVIIVAFTIWVICDNETPLLVQLIVESLFYSIAWLWKLTKYDYSRSEWREFCNEWQKKQDEYLDSLNS